MNDEDVDAFRSELLRQKIIFEAELRRQREAHEERFAAVAQELAAREADCRNLQSVITILGRKVDALTEQVARRPPTPRRMSTPPRTPSLISDDDLIKPPQHLGTTSARRSATEAPSTAASPPHANPSHSLMRRPSPLISASSPSTITVMNRISSLAALSRTSSPSRNLTAGPTPNTHPTPHATGNGTAAAPAAATHEESTPSSARGPPFGSGSSAGGGGGGHPYRAVARRKNSQNSARGSAAGSATEEDDNETARAGHTATSAPSPRTIRGRPRSLSLRGKRRNESAHRLNDVKVTDDW